MAGWFGSDPSRQFEMAVTFHPAADAGRFLIGTPHILSLAPLLGALDVVNRAGMASIRKKSLELTRFLRVQVEERLTRLAVQVVTPRLDDARGSHLTLKHSEATSSPAHAVARRDPRLPTARLTAARSFASVYVISRVPPGRGDSRRNTDFPRHEQLPETDAAVT